MSKVSQPISVYAAYGSNTNVAELRAWLGGRGYSPDCLRVVDTGTLPDWDVAFGYDSATRQGGVLDLRPRVGQATPCVLFEVVTPEGWRALDAKEGAPRVYERFTTTALTDDGVEIAVRTYRVTAARAQRYVKPTPAYLDVVRAGLAMHGLPTEHVEAAAKDELTPWHVDAIFAYGTLLRGECRHDVLRQYGVACLLLAECHGRLLDCGPFPAMTLENVERGQRVQGEFVRLEGWGDAVAALDCTEGFRGFGKPGSLYRRTLVDVHVGDGRLRRAWAYVLRDASVAAGNIASGCWRRHVGRRHAQFDEIAATHLAGQEVAVAGQLLARERVECPGIHDPAKVAAVVAHLLLSGELSERRLAQVSGRWPVSGDAGTALAI